MPSIFCRVQPGSSSLLLYSINAAPRRGYSRFQVTGMIEVFFWGGGGGGNYQFQDFLGWENLASNFLGWLDLSSDFWGYSKQSEDSW